MATKMPSEDLAQEVYAYYENHKRLADRNLSIRQWWEIQDVIRNEPLSSLIDDRMFEIIANAEKTNSVNQLGTDLEDWNIVYVVAKCYDDARKYPAVGRIAIAKMIGLAKTYNEWIEFDHHGVLVLVEAYPEFTELALENLKNCPLSLEEWQRFLESYSDSDESNKFQQLAKQKIRELTLN